MVEIQVEVITNAGPLYRFKYESEIIPSVGDYLTWEGDINGHRQLLDYSTVFRRSIREYLFDGERETKVDITVVEDA